jgi:hypothetical protein
VVTQLADQDAAPVVGTRLGRYLFLREIATGPFGPLYELRGEEEARGLSGLGRVVILAPELDPDAEEAIVASAWDCLELRHANALCVADVVFGKGWVTLVHDFAEGSLLRSLQARAQERSSTFPLAIALRIITDVIEGLEQTQKVCESAGIAWTPGGTNTSSLYLCGDGRTRSLDGQLVFTLLRTDRRHTRLGEAQFSAPEVTSADAQVDERTAVFSVGAVLWELLTGGNLNSVAAKSSKSPSRAPVPKLNLALPKGAARVPPGLARAVDSALEFEPAKRPATLAAFKSALSRDVEVASYAQVIDFTDALLHRESTLFRLTLDPEPKLSDELRTNKAVPAHHDWTLELAQKARLAADIPRPATAAPKRAAAATPRMKAPSLTFPATRTELSARPGTFVPTLHQPTQQPPGKSVHRTLLGISPQVAMAGRVATTVTAAAPDRLELPAATVTEAISEVQPVASTEIAVRAPDELAVPSKACPRSIGDPAATDVSLEPMPLHDTALQLSPPTLPVEAPSEPAPLPTTEQRPASASVDDRVDDTFIRRKAVVQLTPFAIATWSIAMICVSALATLALQRFLTSVSGVQAAPASVSAVVLPSSAPVVATNESSNVPVASETEPHSQSAPNSEPRASATPQAEAAPATSQPPLAVQPSAPVATSATRTIPKRSSKNRKRRYIPRGL